MMYLLEEVVYATELGDLSLSFSEGGVDGVAGLCDFLHP